MANNISSSLPAITIEIESHRYSGIMIADLPAVFSEVGSGASLGVSIPMLLIEAAGITGGVGSISAPLAAITGLLDVGKEFDAVLPALVAEMTGQTIISAKIVATIPRLSFSGESGSENVVNIFANMPRAIFSGFATNHPVGNILARLGSMQVDMVALVGYPADLVVTLPGLRFSGEASRFGDNDFDVDLPAVTMDGTVVNLCEFELVHTRGQVR